MDERVKHDPIILIVEDDENIRNLIEISIRKATEWQTVSVNCGPHAIEAWDKSEFDVIIMDLRLPLMGGIESVRIIRKLEKSFGRKHTPILAFTARVDSETRQECFDTGFDDFIAKPAKIREMIEAVSKHIRN
jgi:osomolarity two-component system, sensor histidine kinase NIK1